jgi:hypothetical protein
VMLLLAFLDSHMEFGILIVSGFNCLGSLLSSPYWNKSVKQISKISHAAVEKSPPDEDDYIPH